MTTELRAAAAIRVTSKTARAASKAGLKLDLHQQGDDWCWHWSNGVKGATSASSKRLALVMACDDIALFVTPFPTQ